MGQQEVQQGGYWVTSWVNPHLLRAESSDSEVPGGERARGPEPGRLSTCVTRARAEARGSFQGARPEVRGSERDAGGGEEEFPRGGEAEYVP